MARQTRSRKLAYNTISSLIFEITTIVCGLILPRLILLYYGSNVNGLINSISQFLGIISFLDLGVGAVVQTSFYKPLAEKDSVGYSKIYKSSHKFFKKVGLILLIYVIVLSFIYPFFTNGEMEWDFVVTLLLVISISYFAQYFFGVTDSLLISADQRGYVQYNIKTITLIINTIACIIAIKLNAPIQVVKLTTSVIFLARPVIYHFYVKKHYDIQKMVQYDVEPIKQKYNGIAQHVSSVILDNTDIIVLTIFSNLIFVSIYSVYCLVINGVRSLMNSLSSGIGSLLGELIAKKETGKLNFIYNMFEWINHNMVIVIFGCCATLIVPFIKIYTSNISDTNYIQPIFALLMTLAMSCSMLRRPYLALITAAGHFKETQLAFIISAIINIILSIVLVIFYGLIGVAIGTLVAMVFQTVWLAIYSSKKIIHKNIVQFFKYIFIDIILFVGGYFAVKWINISCTNYFSWIGLAFIHFAIWSGIVLLGNIIFNFKLCKQFFMELKLRFLKNR